MNHTSSDLAPLFRRIEEQCLSNKKIIVAIDGYGGAGKSSLARKLVEEISLAGLVEFDWFHLPRNEIVSDDHFDVDRFQRQILIPFLDGSPTLFFQRYNWGYLAKREEALEPGSLAAEALQVLVIEGAMTLHQELCSSYHLKIWVATPPEVARKRGIKRDIEEYGLEEETVRKAWKEWGRWEDRCLDKDNRRERADFIVN